MHRMKLGETYGVLLAVLLLVGCRSKKDSKDESPPCATARVVDRESARKMVLAMPVAKALERGVVENGGIGIAVYAEESPNRYWEVTLYGNYHDHHPRYETFLVRTDGEEILKLDFMD